MEIINKEPSTESSSSQHVSLWALMISFFRLGSTTFGGMWAVLHKLEQELVTNRGWLTAKELQTFLIASAIVPAPHYTVLSGLVGYKMKGWLGAFVCTFFLILPPALLVLSGVVLINPSLLAGPLEPLSRVVSIAVVGLLFGNAFRQMQSPMVRTNKKIAGIFMGIAVTLAVILGAPLISAAIIGLIAGAIVIKPEDQLKQVDGR